MSTLSSGNDGSLQEIERGKLPHSSKPPVPYTIVHGWDPKSSIECDIEWKKGWLALLDLITQEEPDDARQAQILSSVSMEDHHWDWFGKALQFSTDEYNWFHLYAEDKPQAACLIYHPKTSALEAGEIFYIKFVAVAPWNRECDIRPREFRGLGRIMLKTVQRFAVKELKLRPGFCLHSLPKAEGFYLKLKMVKVEGKEDAGSLAYYELPQSHATQMIEAD